MPRCPVCQDVVATGCNCDVADGVSFEWNGTGTEASPLTISPILSVDVDQLLTCELDGLEALVPDLVRYPPTVEAYNTTNLSIANNTATTVTCNTELYDTDSMHSISSNTSRITFATAGLYIVNFVCAWNKNSIGDRVAWVRKNGSDASILSFESKRTGGSDLIVGHCVTLEDTFVATDYVEGRVQQTSGGNLLLLGDSYSPFLGATRVA